MCSVVEVVLGYNQEFISIWTGGWIRGHSTCSSTLLWMCSAVTICAYCNVFVCTSSLWSYVCLPLNQMKICFVTCTDLSTSGTFCGKSLYPGWTSSGLFLRAVFQDPSSVMLGLWAINTVGSEVSFLKAFLHWTDLRPVQNWFHSKQLHVEAHCLDPHHLLYIQRF